MVGFGIFGKTAIGLSGAGIGYYATSEKAKAKITAMVEVKYLGLYRRENKIDDRSSIITFVENKLKMPNKQERFQLYQEGIGKILGNQMKNGVPGVIIYFHTTKIQSKI